MERALETPEKIRSLQRKLYEKAKREPDFRFYLLYDKVWRPDILRHAYERAHANGGAPGVDGETFHQIASADLEDWLARLGEELRTKTYQPQAVRRVMIPKPGGGERPLGIPTIRDRVAQAAAKLVLEPIFEADMEPPAFGYRPKRGAREAIQSVMVLLRQGYTDVVDADLSKYLDTIAHDRLMARVAEKISDGRVLALIEGFLRQDIMKGLERWTPATGTPQGAVISPLLANIYLHPLDLLMEEAGIGWFAMRTTS